jgi:hypothetical protein
MDAEALLELGSPSLLVIEERTRREIVVGVPHHAPAGKAGLPCLEHQESDENAGYLGRYLAEKLRCCSVIACNYTIDSNKYFRSDYSMQIASWNPKALIEIHGHNGRKAKHDIEISSGGSGSERHAGRLADALTAAFQATDELRNVTVCGEYDGLYYKASDAVTLSDGRWIGYHIELPPRLRKIMEGMDGKPPEIGYRFCDLLADAVQTIHRK